MPTPTDFIADPFNAAIREYQQRCKKYAEAENVGSADGRFLLATLGPLTIIWDSKHPEMRTYIDGDPAHQELNDYIVQASEALVWEGLRLLRQHYILDELSTI